VQSAKIGKANRKFSKTIQERKANNNIVVFLVLMLWRASVLKWLPK